MNHIALLIICILSVEIFLFFNFFKIIDSLIKVFKKVIYLITNKNISDHWKEKVVPIYAFKLMKLSIQILFIISTIISFFIITDYFLENFLMFTISFFGIIESMTFVLIYFLLRKPIIE